MSFRFSIGVEPESILPGPPAMPLTLTVPDQQERLEKYMFTPLDRLPRLDPDDRAKYRRRWKEDEGPELREKILRMIRAGAGEDSLARVTQATHHCRTSQGLEARVLMNY